jgi:hypothetical protein
MAFQLLQALSYIVPGQPPLTQIKPLILWYTSQVGEHLSLLGKNLACQQDFVSHCLQNPEIQHFSHFWMLCLLDLFHRMR